MKKIFVIILFLLGLTILQAQPYRGGVTVTRHQLEERGDTLHMELGIWVNGEAMSNCQSWTIVPFLTDGEKVLKEFPAILVNSNNKRQMYERQRRFGNPQVVNRNYYKVVNLRRADLRRGAGTTTIDYVMDVPYEMWMDEATLALRQELTSCAGEKQIFTVATGGHVLLQPRVPYAINPMVAFFTPVREQKQRNVQAQAFLDFVVGRSVIDPNFRRNPEELAKIKEIVTRVQNDPDVQKTDMFIEGYASPEGSFQTNQRLSKARALALQKYMKKTFDIPSEKFKVSSVGEDWGGLRVLVEQSSIAHREEILAIIDSNDGSDRKEQRLRALAGGAPFRTMLNEMFPQLRRVEYQINFNVRDYSTEEARALVDRNPEYLSQYELFQVAKAYPQGSPEFNHVFDQIIRLFPDDPTANINAAGVMLLRGENNTAKRFLDKAMDDPRVYNNLGVYYLKAGDLDKAEEYFTKANLQSLPEAKHNLNEVVLKREDNARMERFNRR